jgi:sodium/hydrogen antiporter
MNEYVIAIVAIGMTAWAMVSRRLGRTAVTGTMLFAGLGLVIGPEALALVDLGGILGRSDFVSALLTVTLVVVLFTDASAINASNWREDIVPARLLGFGLPLSMAFGWGAALVVLGDLEVWEAAVLAAMLAPTDAALGQAVVSNPRVPQRIRQALNIESGLNDGIALPFFVVFVEAAEAAESSLAVTDLAGELLRQMGIAVAVGVALGAVGARGLAWAIRREYAAEHWRQIGLVTLAIAAYALATPLGGSGFIAAWVAGLVVGRWIRAGGAVDPHVSEFAETTGDFLTLASFLVFGIYLGPVLVNSTWQMWVYAALSLTVVRLGAVGLALVGQGMTRPSILYIGWFGPRGLATLILTIEIVEGSGLDHASTIAGTALVTVAASVVLHGVTAWWGSNRYADRVGAATGAAALAEHAAPIHEVRVPLRAQRHVVRDEISRG